LLGLHPILLLDMHPILLLGMHPILLLGMHPILLLGLQPNMRHTINGAINFMFSAAGCKALQMLGLLESHNI
jgi:hypothetical protein